MVATAFLLYEFIQKLVDVRPHFQAVLFAAVSTAH